MVFALYDVFLMGKIMERHLPLLGCYDSLRLLRPLLLNWVRARLKTRIPFLSHYFEA